MDKQILEVKNKIDKMMNMLVRMDIPRDKAIKKAKKHLKGDIKGFKHEEAEDRELLKTLRGKKNGRSKSNSRSKKKRA
jgi:hypothetical protein